MSGENYFRNSEQAALGGGPSFYTGKGKTTSPKVGFFGKRKRGFIALIIMASLGIGGGVFLSSSNSLLAPAIESLFTEATDTQYTSYSMRNVRLTQLMLNNDYPVSTSGWTGIQKYNLTNSFINRLAEYNIKVEGTGANRILKYTNASGETIDIPASQFANTYQENLDFRDAYMSAKRGRVATFFDDIASTIYNKLGISRNLFSDYKQSGDAEANTQNYRDTMSKKFEGDTTEVSANEEFEHTYTDEEGNSHTSIVQEEVGNDTATSGSSVSSESMSKARSYFSSVVGSVSKIANWSCTALMVGNMISMAVAANEIYQSINYFMGIMENISKMKAGEGDASAINEVLNFFSTPAESSVQDYNNPNVNYAGQDTTIEIEEVQEQTGSPLEASGVQLILANAPTTSSTTANYSLERAAKVLGGALSTAGASLGACSILQAGSSIVSLLTTTIIPGSGIVKTLGGFLVKFALSSVAGIVLGSILSFIIPTIAQALFTNAFEDATGIKAGQLFTKGAFASNSRVGRSGSGQSLSSKTQAIQFAQATNTVLAMDAELDRYTSSPFDITNKNTFLGSIAYSLLATTTSTGASNLSTLLRTTASSISNALGSVSAAGSGTSYTTTFGDCPNLEEIGAAGDLYCNPITTTDLSTIDLDPTDPTYVEVISKQLNCTEDGSCTVIDEEDPNDKTVGNLAKYIAYCDNRDSPFGIADANILNELAPSSSLGIGGTIAGSLPIIGDLLSAADAISNLENMNWATGANCVNTEKNQSLWNSELKYYQRYIEDQRILEQMGAYDNSENPVTAYIEKYEAEHPTDNSPAGYLSRISGLTLADAELVLSFGEYYTFIANYDPENRLAMEGDTTELKSGETVVAEIQSLRYRYQDQNLVDTPESTTIAQHIIYADLRTRTLVA